MRRFGRQQDRLGLLTRFGGRQGLWEEDDDRWVRYVRICMHAAVVLTADGTHPRV